MDPNLIIGIAALLLILLGWVTLRDKPDTNGKNNPSQRAEEWKETLREETVENITLRQNEAVTQAQTHPLSSTRRNFPHKLFANYSHICSERPLESRLRASAEIRRVLYPTHYRRA